MEHRVTRVNPAAFRMGTVIVIVLIAVSARAQNLVVDCTGQNQNAYHSINDALANMPFQAAQVVMQVTGTCHEVVYLGQVRNLMIAAPLGQRATIQGDGVSFATLYVDASTGIYLYGLNITGAGSDGMSVGPGAEVRMDSCTFQNNPGNGMSVSDDSSVLIYSASFTGNGRGINIGANSTVDHASWALGSVMMSANTNSGLWLSGGRYSTGGNTTIQNNGFGATTVNDGFGTLVYGAGQVQFGNYAGPNLITGNRTGGVSLNENGEVSFWGGTNTVTNNGGTGIQGRSGSQLTLAGNVEVSGHTAFGLDISSKSHAFIDASSAANVIHNNGTGSLPVRAGIRIDGNSQLLLSGPNQIVQNGGPGVLGDINSSIDVSGSTISGNQSEGIRLLHQTVLNLGSGVSLSGNGGAAITCDSTSLLIAPSNLHLCQNTQISDSSLHEAVESAPVVPNFSGKMQEYKRFRSLIPRPQH